MTGKQFTQLLAIAMMIGSGVRAGFARDITLTMPRRSQLTPVQRLNREGVEAIQKRHYEKAEAIFYKAYLYDAADPFTLNNLGYVAELQGNLERAQKFYSLASNQSCSAVIDRSNAKQLVGKPMAYALGNSNNGAMQVNRMNVDAIHLLSQKRNVEAGLLLRKALALDSNNSFTLNNLGVTDESIGDLEGALKYYDIAAASHSQELIVVTSKHTWRGRPVSEMAADSALRLRKRMNQLDIAKMHATMLTLRGVSAANRNDWQAAKEDFRQASSIDPDSAFSLNNLGYIAEKDGDLETAQFYYAKARMAPDANTNIGLATQRSAEGQHMAAVAGDSSNKVGDELDRYSKSRREQKGPIELIPRGSGNDRSREADDSTPFTNVPSADATSHPQSEQ